jgi:predicted RNase H-like HicB family nuclease
MTEAMIKIKIEKLEEGGYLATSDTLQGLIAQGRTIAETIEIAQDVAKKLIESYIEHGDELPFEIKTKKDFTISVPVSVNA